MPKSKVSLKIKFVALILILVAVSMLLVAFTTITRETNKIKEDTKAKGFALTKTLAKACINVILQRNYDVLQQYVDELSEEKDIEYVIITDHNNICLAHSDHNYDGKELTDETSLTALSFTSPTIQVVKKNRKEIYDITVPLIESSVKLGLVRIGFSLDGMHREQKKALLQIILITSATSVFAGLISLFLARIVTNPIQILLAGTKAISNGNLEHIIKVNTNDEVGELADEFNKMTSSLRESWKKIKLQNIELEDHKKALERKILEISTLHEIGKVINSSLVIDEVFKLLINSIAEVTKCSSCSLMLIDKKTDELYIKSSFGLKDDVVKNFRLNKNEGLCGCVVSDSKPILIGDVTKDKRYVNPTTDILSYMGTPISVHNEVIGVINVEHKSPNAFDEDDMRLLTTLANDASIAIENARLYEQVKDKERLDEDMRIAKMIQLSLLPPSEPSLPDLEIYSVMRPAKEVGGDYYDYIYDKDNKETSIVIGDVSGKGVTAGIFMVIARTIIHSSISIHKTTKEIISHANSILSKDMGEERFMSMLLMRWYANQEKFKYTGAGHEHIIVYRKESRSCEIIKSGGLILGVEPNADSQFQEKDLLFNKGDIILLYTDGVTESINKSKKMFGLKRLVDFVEKNGDNSPKDLINTLMDEIDKFVDGNIQRDDITLLAIRRK